MSRSIVRAAADWFQDYMEADDGDFQVAEYELTAVPNDFNVMTIYQFLESGAVKIPNFQRNYIWDIRRASKLIESLILGLPVPQIFLYEEDRNRFLVIDGQQRLMSIYYFIKGRFPRKEKRVALRQLFDRTGGIPADILTDDGFFMPFVLTFSDTAESRNRFSGLSYGNLAAYRSQFELRPIRNVIVKQSAPPNDDSAAYEIFNRLNSGGVNISSQEIRGSLFHSEFFTLLHKLNVLPGWRRLLGLPDPDLHMKDIEILLRGFAILVAGRDYSPSMTRFLNAFSRRARAFPGDTNAYLGRLFRSFLAACTALPDDSFLSSPSKRFNVALFEAVFAVTCEVPFAKRARIVKRVPEARLGRLSKDKRFIRASQEGTTKKSNVQARLKRARAILAS